MKKLEISTIYWDGDATLWSHRGNEYQVLSEYFGIQERELLQKQFLQMISQFLPFLRDKKVFYHRVAKLVEKTMPLLSDYHISGMDFLMAWVNSSAQLHDLTPEAPSVLAHAKQKQIRNVLETDFFFKAQKANLSTYGILDYFDDIRCVDENYLKCNPLRNRGSIDKNAVVVGDSLYSDFAFARYHGLKFIWYNPNQQIATGVQPDYEISSLLEIQELLF